MTNARRLTLHKKVKKTADFNDCSHLSEGQMRVRSFKKGRGIFFRAAVGTRTTPPPPVDFFLHPSPRKSSVFQKRSFLCLKRVQFSKSIFFKGIISKKNGSILDLTTGERGMRCVFLFLITGERGYAR